MVSPFVSYVSGRRHAELAHDHGVQRGPAYDGGADAGGRGAAAAAVLASPGALLPIPGFGGQLGSATLVPRA
eukprot:12034683-Alexandrium_andersonii.AAC.1